MAFSVGDRVHSRRVGAREAFNGEVVEVREAIKEFSGSYDVKDVAGQLWNRSAAELTRIEVAA